MLCSITLPPRRSTPFPSTTLFRSFADEGPEVDGFVPPVDEPVAGEADDRLPPGDRARRDEDRDRRVDGDARHEPAQTRSEEHTSELQSRRDIVCRLLLDKEKMTWS